MHELTALRSSILAALGVASVAACGGSTTVDRPATGTTGATTTTSTTTSTTSTTSTTTGAGGHGGGGGAPASACKDPVALAQADGSPSGYVRCADGAVNRAEAVACVDATPPGAACQGDETQKSCTTDADCTQGAYGRCLHVESAGPDFGSTYCACSYGCRVDADCAWRGPDHICACAATGGPVAITQCLPAGCKRDADCASGECGVAGYDDGCGHRVYAVCREASDTCRTDATCTDAMCSSDGPGTHYECRGTSCAIGRPMTVDGVARTAPSTARADWAGRVDVDAAAFPADVRAALAARWAEVAALEHASIGSFARFTLQLLALGAPPGLVAETQRATLDEVEHARAAYALASAFAGAPVGPGPLEGAGEVVSTDAPSIVRALVEEACVGETLGVAEALALAGAIGSPALAAVHRRIAEDEQRHAELAWRTLAWLLGRDASLAEVAHRAMEAAIGRACAGASSDALVAEDAGLTSAGARAAVRRRAAEDVVRPCMAALIAATPAA